MEITRSEAHRRYILDAIAKREFKERVGVHCSDLIYCLNKQALRKIYPIPPTDAELLLFSLGWASQRWLTGKPEDADEKMLDGITVTADDLVDNGIPWELKATYQSSRRPVEESVHWIRQIMAQCAVHNANQAYLSRLELMGDWSHPKKGEPPAQKPTLSAYHLQFANAEVNANWKWLVSRRDMYLEVLATKKLLPKALALASGMEFECGRCNYAGKECTV